MTASAPTITVRLPDSTRKALDRIAKATRRSRSYLVKEAIERHIDEIALRQAREEPRQRLARLMALAGAGASLSTYKSAEEVDAAIRAIRGDE
jgi:predicted transcriptional regulator